MALMVFVMPTRYKDLAEAIKKRDFPIIVHGPSGSGKTYSILRILRELGLRLQYVELSCNTINKPLDSSVVVLAHLYSHKDLENIKYSRNVIIESNLGNLNKLSGYKLIKFNRITVSMAKRHGIQNFDGNLFSLGFGIPQKRYEIDLFRFLGKVFYKKLSIADVSVADGFTHYSVGGGDGHVRTSVNLERTRPVGGDGSSDSLLSFDDDLLFSSQICGGDECVDDPVRNLKGMVCQLPVPSNVIMSMETGRIERYLFANFLHFSSPRDFTEIYDCLSLMDIDQTNILVFMQCMKERGRAIREFYSFTPGKYPEEVDDKSAKGVRRHWMFGFYSAF